MIYFKNNIIYCKKCGDMIKYLHDKKESNPGYMIYCRCGAVGLDPSACMYRIIGDPGDFEDMSESWDYINKDENDKRGKQ